MAMKWWHVVGCIDGDGNAVPLVAMPATPGLLLFNDSAFDKPLWVWTVEATSDKALEVGRDAYIHEQQQAVSFGQVALQRRAGH